MKLLKVKYMYQRLVKRHIDGALMRRNVQSREKRRMRTEPHRKQPFTRLFPPEKQKYSPANHDRGIMVLPLVEYATLWDDVEQVNPERLLKNVPTLSALEYVVALQNRVLYAFSDIKSQARMLLAVAKLFGGEEGRKILSFVNRMTRFGMKPILMDNYSCLYFFLLALQNYNEVDRPLTEDDQKNIIKAYLYCSHVWLDDQQHDIQGLNLTELSLRVDLPVVEFKSPKDFKVQLFKASRFFEFCKQIPHFGQFASWFFADKGVANASEYLLSIFNLVANTAKEPIPVYFQFKHGQVDSASFLDQFVIDPAFCKDLWDKKNFAYLRNHFLLKTQDGHTGELRFMVLNALLMTDKFYQGMMFDMSDSVIRNGGGNYTGKPFRNKGDFNAFIGNEFSEHLLYDALELACPFESMVKLRGEYLKANGVVGEPDYCIQDGNWLYLFEYKDVMMNDQVKRSSDMAVIKNTIFDRLCKYEQGRMKGAGQLLYSIDNIFNHHSLDEFGIDTSRVKEIFPIIVTTDSAFNATGVNELVKTEFRRILSSSDINVSPRIMAPVIVDYETFFNLIIPLRKKQTNLCTLLCKYNDMTRHGSLRMMPFCGFVKDYYPLPLLVKSDLPVLFGDFMKMINAEQM